MHAVPWIWQYLKQYFLLSPVEYLCLGWEIEQCRDSVKFASWIPVGSCLKEVPSLLQHRAFSHRAAPTLDWKTNALNIFLFLVPLDECCSLLHTPTALTLGQQLRVRVRGSNRRGRKGFSGNSLFSLGIPEVAHEKISRLKVAHGPGIEQELQLCFVNPLNPTKEILYAAAFFF